MRSVKLLPLPRLAGRISRLKRRGKTVVFTNGCFDLIHYGHVRYLAEAKRKGDILVVGVNSDASVRRIKGPRRPIVGEADRAGVVAGLESVDYVVIFGDDTPFGVIKKLRPDVLIKGADWKREDIVGAELVAGYGGTVARIALQKGRSTTALIKKIVERF